jgi:hypothetical protein
VWKLLEVTTSLSPVISVLQATELAKTGATLWLILWLMVTVMLFIIALRKNHLLQVLKDTLW